MCFKLFSIFFYIVFYIMCSMCVLMYFGRFENQSSKVNGKSKKKQKNIKFMRRAQTFDW